MLSNAYLICSSIFCFIWQFVLKSAIFEKSFTPQNYPYKHIKSKHLERCQKNWTKLLKRRASASFFPMVSGLIKQHNTVQQKHRIWKVFFVISSLHFHRSKTLVCYFKSIVLLELRTPHRGNQQRTDLICSIFIRDTVFALLYRSCSSLNT